MTPHKAPHFPSRTPHRALYLNQVRALQGRALTDTGLPYPMQAQRGPLLPLSLILAQHRPELTGPPHPAILQPLPRRLLISNSLP